MLDGKQIKDNSISAAKLLTTFLNTIVRADGSVAMTGNLDLNGNRVINLAQPVNPNDAARLGDIYAIPWKDKVLAATTGNVTLSAPQTIDGIALIAGNRVLVRAQTLPEENGIYIVAAGAWSRSADADSATELRGAVVLVEQGTVNADKRYAQTADNITLGTTAITWVDIGTGTPAAFASQANKDMTASVTTADFQLACATAITITPSGDGYVNVDINGLRVSVGDGVRTKDCYFSNDSGATARAISAITAGDALYWVQSVAGYNLAASDKVDLDYAV
jgi:hypothetical protein